MDYKQEKNRNQQAEIPAVSSPLSEIETCNLPVSTISLSRQVAITGVLLAIGALLRMITPPVAGITPNFVIAMYCLAILLLCPNWKGALSIGFAGGLVAMMFSKSPVPYLNLITEPAGALACSLIVRYMPSLTAGRVPFKPFLAGAIGTLVSGTLYVILNFKLVLALPDTMMKAAFVGVVLPVTAINAVIDQVLYLPAIKATGIEPAGKEKNEYEISSSK